ncbi:MAG: deoxyribonuclease V [Chloroflexaceae bacterium]|nr:deoxyribonuclease V [Chloroflexaceae bacterium]
MHPWPTTADEAIAIQEQLRSQVCTVNELDTVQTVAGVDVGFEQENTIARAAVVVLRYPELEPIDHALARQPVTFPYIPGLLSFRESPVVLDALAQLQHPPDVLICDGQGLAHPRRCGIACHLGLLTNIPAIGCAKSRLIGQHDPPPVERGDWVALTDQGETIGAVLCTRQGTRPLYVSPGHRISLERSIALVLGCTTRYRLPETTRMAHNLASHGVLPQRQQRLC